VEQLDLGVDTIQPNEAYLVYLNIHEEWDAWIDNPEYDEHDFGWRSGRQIECRKCESSQHLIGVVVDDVTYRKLLDRAEPYARKYEEDLRTKTTLKDYKVRCEYTFEMNRRLILT
jgi:hypothetical protein